MVKIENLKMSLEMNEKRLLILKNERKELKEEKKKNEDSIMELN